MLVLSRKKNESIKIGSNVSVVVVDIRGDKVRLGVEAPRDVPVDRNEVAKAKAISLQLSKAQPTEGPCCA